MSRALATQPARYRPSRRAVAYVLAVVLPLLSTAVTVQVAALHSFPMALGFLSMALIATLGGLGPSLLAVVLSVLSRGYQILPDPRFHAMLRAEIFRSCVLLCGALIISLLSRRRRISELRLEVALSQLHERTDALVDSLNNAKCASWTLDFDIGDTKLWYKGSYPVFGRPFSELEKLHSVGPLLHPDDQPRVKALLQHMRTTWEPVGIEYRVQWPNGEIHTLEMRGHRIPGKNCLWRGVTLDITERKLAEAAVLRSEKLAAMGRVASTVAHEINNPLEALTNLLFLANADETMEATTRSYLSLAERELARLGNITRLTLGFVRTNGKATEVEAAGSIEDVVSLLQHRFHAGNIAIERNFQPGVRISIPLHEFRQVATNLIANAADAVSGEGAKIALHIIREQGYAVLIVEDNGDGIPAHNLQRIFDPFFSTKDEIGTGIGLWVTKEIVEKNGGTISVESGDLPSGFRTRFRIEFPLAASIQDQEADATA